MALFVDVVFVPNEVAKLDVEPVGCYLVIPTDVIGCARRTALVFAVDLINRLAQIASLAAQTLDVAHHGVVQHLGGGLCCRSRGGLGVGAELGHGGA